MIFFVRDGQLGPCVEDGGGRGRWPALEFGFDGPRDAGLVVAGENGVDACRVSVFGVDKEAVHIEETGTNWWEAGARRVRALFF